ncbi:uncharacterized protein PHACADRAFT_198833 [Phanerochaete carnosa HHB-10118-sp]|uniref:NTF2 domain-containing protein n=1 Tax=Phanerochaete carnosa (strain HHB-10118-sp) TaxID=650164 RepID=K5W1P4_PHACS|nr:uncharacterized protein PHACADRAFT_198833 [Phanerochaete carnosa HHB-10118-sp]EKM52784.1 hypothetical protein PHACADRAFT_198833 [Phanerochaete carnosa HHB-10118-sp]
MAANIVLPPLTTWAEEHITALFNTTDESTFNEAFDNFVAASPSSIVVNGQRLTRAQYKDQVWKDKFLEAAAQVQYLGAVSVPKDENDPIKAGEVGVFLQATIDERLLVLGAPETRNVTLSLNLNVIQDPMLKPPSNPGGIHGFFDGRRVASIVAVSTSNPNATVLPSNPGGPIINPGGPIKPPTGASSD